MTHAISSTVGTEIEHQRIADAAAIGRLIEQTTRAVYGCRGPRAVHPGQWAVLRYIASASREGRTLRGVAEHLGVTHSPVSRAVATLARKALVTVQPDVCDRRLKRIDLTALGRELLNCDPTHRLTSAIATLSTDQRSSLAAALSVVSGSLDVANGDAQEGWCGSS